MYFSYTMYTNIPQKNNLKHNGCYNMAKLTCITIYLHNNIEQHTKIQHWTNHIRWLICLKLNRLLLKDQDSLRFISKRRVRVMVFNTTFNNISAILWRSVLLVEETRVPGVNHRPAASHWQTLSHNVVLSLHLAWAEFELFKRNLQC